jgi:RNA polymerase-binding transcription factor DksA
VRRPRASARPVGRVARLTEDQTNLLSERVLDGLAETCRACGTRLDFEQLLAAPRAVACGGCRPAVRSRADRREADDGDA